MGWYQFGIVFAVAFVATYLMVPAAKRLSVVLGAMDHPGKRRVNTHEVPRAGGIAIYAGLSAGCFALFLGVRFFGWSLDDLYVLEGLNYPLLFVGLTVMFAVGLVDDITQLSVTPKLMGQIAAASIVAAAGVTIGAVRTPIEGGYLDLVWLDFPVTVLYLVAFVNAINLADGLDGLASGMVAIMAAGLFYLVFARGGFTIAAACVVLAAACLAFLRYNFYPASVFMGDSGALTLGLCLGIVSILGVVRAQSFIIMLVPLVIAGVPVLDTLSSIVRRLRAHESVGQADMGHVHHRLMKAGLGQLKSVAVLWACTAALTFVACLLVGASGWLRWGMFAVLAVAVFYVIRRFGLFGPVLRHHYDRKGKRGPRVPRKQYWKSK